jgi:predicted protein tyrosine phosphatase
MQVKVLNDAALQTQVFGEDSVLISIVGKEERIPEAVEQAVSVLFLDFDDLNPENEEQLKDFDSYCNLEEVTAVLEVLEDPSVDVVYVHSTNNSSRSLAVAAGLLSSKEEDCKEVLYQIVSQDPSTQPNYWVLALFDWVLGLCGALTTAADDYLATGEVVSKSGRIISHTN